MREFPLDGLGTGVTVKHLLCGLIEKFMPLLHFVSERAARRVVKCAALVAPVTLHRAALHFVLVVATLPAAVSEANLWILLRVVFYPKTFNGPVVAVTYVAGKIRWAWRPRDLFSISPVS